VSAHAVRVRPDTYEDSVLLMSTSRTMRDQDEVEWATAVMGTEANLEELREQGFSGDELGSAGANDLVLAVRAGSEDAARTALEVGERTLSEGGDEEAGEERPRDQGPRSLPQALEAMSGANVALVSVPGEYAALEAHKALSAGLHVLLFSDNVPLEDEVALKERGERLGRFVMGPGAGTAMLGGVGLGFANAVPRGPVGVVAAAGTGAQESMSLLGRWGPGIRDLIGVGGRDLSKDVGGRMMRLGIEAFADDDETEVLLIVSKPPAPEVASDLLERLGKAGKPAVAALLGLREQPEAPESVRLARTLEEGIRAILEIIGREAPDPAAGLVDRVSEAVEGLEEDRRAIRGLFSGGTLCYEAMVVISERLGAVHSNVPLREGWGLPAPDGAHVCLDMGEEEFTKGRAHPMIDPELRIDRIREEAGHDDVAVILLDVVLGYGAMDDPAGALAPACAEAVERGVRVVAYVLGTDDDPQGLEDQRGAMAEAGCLVAPTGARSALMAAAVADRKPEIAGEDP
jgi:FdrA protein